MTKRREQIPCRWCDTPVEHEAGKRSMADDGHVISPEGEIEQCPFVDIVEIKGW